MELYSIITAGTTIYCGLFFMTESMGAMAQIALFMAILGANTIFLIYWLRQVIRTVCNKFSENMINIATNRLRKLIARNITANRMFGTKARVGAENAEGKMSNRLPISSGREDETFFSMSKRGLNSKACMIEDDSMVKEMELPPDIFVVEFDKSDEDTPIEITQRKIMM
jgi:hypothetical protein